MDISCKECGYPLTGNETSCPECGCPIVVKTTSELPLSSPQQTSTQDSDEYKTFSELFWSCQFYKIFKGHHFDLGQRTYEFGVFLWEMIVLTWHTVWGKFAKFSGRATRREYWSFCFGLPFLCVIPLFFFVAIIPYIAVGVRRMHDTNHSGWWVCVPFAVFFLSLKKSDPYENNYGVLENLKAMALINCPNCGAKITDRAPKCPKCGYVKLSETEQPSNYEIDESISNFSEEQSTGKVWKNITVVFIILVVLCVSGFCLYHYFVNGTEQFSMTDADTTSIQSSSSTAEINTIHNDNTAGFEGLRAIHLIKHADPTQSPDDAVIIHDNWRTQILNLGFIQGGTENSVYEDYGDSEITLISEHFYLNIPEHHIEFIHQTDYEENFEINFENKNDIEKFIESLRDFGYNEGRTIEGERCFDRIKNEKRSTGVEWIIDGNRVYSIHSQY